MNQNNLEVSLRIRLALEEMRRNLAEMNSHFDSAMSEVSVDAGRAGTALETSFSSGTKSAGRSVQLIEDEIKRLQATADGLILMPGTGRSLQEVQEKIRALREEAKTAGTELDHAFRVLGVRSVKDVQTEIAKLDAAMEEVRKSGIAPADADRAMAAYKRQLAELQREIRGAGSSLENAFSVLGVRSVKDIESEVAKLKQAFAEVRQSNPLPADMERASQALKARLGELNAELKMTQKNADDLGTVIRSSVQAIAAAAGGRDFIRANVSLEMMRKALTQIMGDAKAAEKEIDWLRATANRLGIELESAGRAYVVLSAAAKGTSLEGAKTRDIFEAISGAMSKLGKSAVDTEGAILAISQMISKGVVSMEEWRQQLAERLPSAMQATAKALNMSVEEMNDMIASGNVLAEDLLPALRAGIAAAYGTAEASQGAVSGWARFRNVIGETWQFIGDVGIWQAIIIMLDKTAFAVRGLSAHFVLLGEAWGITSAAIATFDWNHPIESIWRWRSALKDASEEIYKKLEKANTAADATAQGQKGLAEGAEQAGAVATESASAWLTVANAYTKVSNAAKATRETAEKEAAAREAEGKAAIELANLMGSEADKRNAAAAAAQRSAAALKALADARQREAGIAASQVVAMEVAARAEEKVSEQKQKLIQAAKEKAAAMQAEADKDAAAALAAQQHAAALDVQSAALKDNSGKVFEYRAALDQAKTKLAEVEVAHRAGKASINDVQAATIAAARAGALYRDALGDVTTAIEARATAAKAANNIAQAEANLALQSINNAIAIAQAKGDEAEVIRLKNEASQMEIRIAKLKAEALWAEAKAQIELARAKREELEASGSLTPAKKAELEAMEAAARVKEVEARAAENAAAHIDNLAKTTREANEAARGAGNSFGGMADVLDNTARRIERLAEGIQRVAGGFRNAANQVTDAQGNVLMAAGDKAGWEDWSDQDLEDVSGDNWRASKYGIDKAGQTAARKELARRKENRLQEHDKMAQAASSSRHEVAISFGGKTTTITTATAGDSQQLVALFRTLESEASRS
jgi:tape measure domain-containing protein